MEKLFNDNYLKKTSEFLLDIKYKSYELLFPKRGDKILEIGCGNGYDSIQLSKRIMPEGLITAIDINQNLLNAAQQQINELGINNIILKNENAEQISSIDNHFDSVRAERVFQHLINPKIVFNEMYRVAKTNAKILIIETDWCSLNLYTGDKDIEDKIKNILLYSVLANGSISKKLTELYAEKKLSHIYFEIIPVTINDYFLADSLVNFSNIISVGVENKTLTPSDKNNWERQIAIANSLDLFRLTCNIILLCGTK